MGFGVLAFLLSNFLIIHFQLLLTRTGPSFMPDFAQVDTSNLHEVQSMKVTKICEQQEMIVLQQLSPSGLHKLLP